MIEATCQLARDCIVATGVAAVFVASVGDDFSIVRVSRDLEASERELRRRWPQTHILAAWWLAEPEALELARRIRRRNPTIGPAADVQGLVIAEAHRRGVNLTAHVSFLHRARQIARRAENALQAASGAGELRWFNRAYHEQRLGGRRMSFGEARGRLRRAILKRLAADLPLQLGPSLLEEVFTRAADGFTGNV